MTKEETEKIHTLYEIYEQPMYRIAYAVLRNSSYAEDAVSDAFMNIIRKIGKIGDPYSPKTKSYIIKTIRNAAIDQYRKNRHFYDRIQPVDDEVFTVPDISVNIESTVSAEEIELLDELNATDRRIMLLRCNEELSWKDIAVKLELTEANVRKRFERAKKKLISLKGEIYNEKN